MLHSQLKILNTTYGNQVTSCVVINCVFNVSVSLMSEKWPGEPDKRILYKYLVKVIFLLWHV